MDLKFGLIFWLFCLGPLGGPHVRMVAGLECDICYRAKAVTGKCVNRPCNSYEDYKKSVDQFLKIYKEYRQDLKLVELAPDTGTYTCMKMVRENGTEILSACSPVPTMEGQVAGQNISFTPRSEPYDVGTGPIFMCDEVNVGQCQDGGPMDGSVSHGHGSGDKERSGGNANIPVHAHPVGILVTLLLFCYFTLISPFTI